MNRFHRFAFAASLIAATASASAQGPTSTDQARAIAAQQTRRQNLAAAFVRPTGEAVATGDYRAQAHQDTLQALAAERGAAVLAYRAGVRSAAIAAQSEDTARAEAARRTAQGELATLADYQRAHGGPVTAAQR